MLGLGNKDKRRAPPVVPGLNIEGGTIAGRYRVEKLLGAGSSGFVVTACHVYLRRRVTLKILASTTSQHQEAQRRHLVAAHQAAALRGRHVAKIVDTGFAENGMPFIATERLEGRTLAEELAERHELPPAEAVRWVLQACEGLAEAHSAGIVHGDLKPQNLFLAEEASTSSTDDGERPPRVLKILDFGMATPVDDRDDEGTVAWFASPAYLAPEQIRDPLNVDARADVWALGVILHELIAGSLPFTADTVSGMLVSVAYDEPAMLVGASGEQGVPFELARIAHACLSKDPSGRPADVAALAKALAPFAGADGLAHAKRAEAALSTPPDVTMTVEPGDGRGGATLTAKPAPPPAHAEARRAPSPSADDQNRRTRAIERRRAGALATVGLAALLALVGLLAPASPAPGAASARELADPSAGALPAAVPVTVLPPRSPSLLVEQPPRTHQPAPSSAAPPSPSPSLERAPRTTPSSTPATRGRPKQVSPLRPRAALSVREDPYSRGFTHPTRLSERRK